MTSAFVHIETLHLFFNLSWVAIFGRVMEPDMGKIRYIALIVVSAAVSSLAQVLFSSRTGIGFSGVVYAFFGYAVAMRRNKPVYGSIADGKTIDWMSAWTIICLVMTYTGEWNIGNAAHISGFLFGLLVGKLSALRLFRRNVGIGLVALSALTLAFSQLQLWDEAKERLQPGPAVSIPITKNVPEHYEDYFIHTEDAPKSSRMNIAYRMDGNPPSAWIPSRLLTPKRISGGTRYGIRRWRFDFSVITTK